MRALPLYQTAGGGLVSIIVAPVRVEGLDRAATALGIDFADVQRIVADCWADDHGLAEALVRGHAVRVEVRRPDGSLKLAVRAEDPEWREVLAGVLAVPAWVRAIAAVAMLDFWTALVELGQLTRVNGGDFDTVAAAFLATVDAPAATH